MKIFIPYSDERLDTLDVDAMLVPYQIGHPLFSQHSSGQTTVSRKQVNPGARSTRPQPRHPVGKPGLR